MLQRKGLHMANYSKLIGALAGILAGLAATQFGVDAGLLEPALADLLLVLCTGIGVYIAPANKK